MIDRIAKPETPDWKEAESHLSDVDPVLAEIIRRIGPCTLSPRKDHFGALCQSILNQQISTAAARTVWERFRKLCPAARPTPKTVAALSEESLRSAGLSRQKATYIHSLSAAFASGAIPTRRWKTMSDEEVVQALIPVKGIGRWTAEMFLIFVLNRTDLLPVDDLGLCNQARRHYKLKKYPDAKRMKKLAEKWTPYRSIATWYLWRSQKLVSNESKIPALPVEEPEN